jgi:hypothetical protein
MVILLETERKLKLKARHEWIDDKPERDKQKPNTFKN